MTLSAAQTEFISALPSPLLSSQIDLVRVALVFALQPWAELLLLLLRIRTLSLIWVS